MKRKEGKIRSAGDQPFHIVCRMALYARRSSPGLSTRIMPTTARPRNTSIESNLPDSGCAVASNMDAIGDCEKLEPAICASPYLHEPINLLLPGFHKSHADGSDIPAIHRQSCAFPQYLFPWKSSLERLRLSRQQGHIVVFPQNRQYFVFLTRLVYAEVNLESETLGRIVKTD